MARARRSRWYDRSRRVIDGLLPQVRPDLGPAAARKFLHAHYPFAAKTGQAWKMWRQAVKDALDVLFPRAGPAVADAPQVRCHPAAGVTCGWCGPDQAGCLVCRDVRERFGKLTADQLRFWAAFLGTCRKEPDGFLILADWVDEVAGLPEEAAHLRRLGRTTR